MREKERQKGCHFTRDMWKGKEIKRVGEGEKGDREREKKKRGPGREEREREREREKERGWSREDGKR